MTEPDVPPEPAPEDDRPGLAGGLPPAFWIALAFGLVCVLAGLAFARLGPRLLAQSPPAAASPLGKPRPPR